MKEAGQEKKSAYFKEWYKKNKARQYENIYRWREAHPKECELIWKRQEAKRQEAKRKVLREKLLL